MDNQKLNIGNSLSRIFAHILDNIFISVPAVFTYFLLIFIASIISTTKNGDDLGFQLSVFIIFLILAFTIIFLIWFIYFIILPLKKEGSTYGKKLLNLKVKRIDGTPVNKKTLLMRELFGKYLLGALTCGVTTIISAIMILTREDRRCIHDMIAHTYIEEDNEK